MASTQPPPTFSVRNHYVPKWYQRRFFEPGQGQTHLWYLDLHPDPIEIPKQPRKFRKAVRHLGPVNCFVQDHLYTLFFGAMATDAIEKQFFGAIDTIGETAVAFYSNYDWKIKGAREAYHGISAYLGAQLFRTPKGLESLRLISKSKDSQVALHALQHVLPMYQAIWAESVWEVVQCKQSPTKFILCDTPVTMYNKGIFPAHTDIRQFTAAHVARLGTHTLFPLDLEHCLVLTNLQYVRNPAVNPVKERENPRFFQSGLFDLRKVQRSRELPEEEVVAINYVLKTMARRYVAAPRKDWLYPEGSLTSKFWGRLGGKYFLMPDPRFVTFSTAFYAGYKDGGAWGTNEYGHRDPDNPRAVALREIEWKTFQAHKAAWDERDRLAGREPPHVSLDYL